MSMTPDDAPMVAMEPIVIQWPASKDLGLPDFSLTIPEGLDSGTLEVYRVPSHEGTGGYVYEALYTESGADVQRPGCEPEQMIRLFTATVSGSTGMYGGDESGASTGSALTVSFVHPSVAYDGEVAGNVSGADPVDPKVVEA